MSSVYDQDGRILADAIRAMRLGLDRGASIYDYSRARVDVDLHRREVYSYGRHFPLFRYIPRDGRRRELFVINGDQFGRAGGGWHSSRTPDHQTRTRALIESTGAPSLIIPFSALDGANIALDSIRPIDVRPDRNWHETREARTLDDVPAHLRREYHPATGETRDRAPDADGMYRWREHFHRLGDCLFSATIDGRRARFLSSFDYQEPAPAYFLVQVPRGAGATVEQAIDSLAPRAVWAARARDIPVYRQGDVFFVETRLTDSDLEVRGIRGRARLTMWDRDARPRKGETGYAAPLDAAGRREMRAYRRDAWRRIQCDARGKLGAPADDDARHAERREARRRLFRAMMMMQARELETARRLAVDTGAPESSRCIACGAPVGAACTREGYGARSCYKRRPISALHREQLDTFRRATRRREEKGIPSTPAGARKKWAKVRADYARDLARARERVRRASFGAGANQARGRSLYGRDDRYGATGQYVRTSAIQRERSSVAREAREARAALASIEARGAVDGYGLTSRRHARDSYRAPFSAGPVARVAWRLADSEARARYIPSEYDASAIEARRRAVRDVLSIYGTAHTAREVIRVQGGAVYVRGRVSHRPLLDDGRPNRWDTRPDHIPLDLRPDRWYLAIRNRVPRARTGR